MRPMHDSTIRPLIAVAVLVSVAALHSPALALETPSLPANSCLSGKIKCVTKRTSCLINCYAKAAKTGVALSAVSDPCLVNCRGKFPSCFSKAELRGGCLVVDDVLDLAARSNTFVAKVATKLDVSPLNDARSCRSGKLKCVARYDKCVQGLFTKAAKVGGPIDLARLAKCTAIVDGGAKGLAGSCFGKLEAKGNCETEGDSGLLAKEDDEFTDASVRAMMIGALEHHNERCTGDTSVKCSSAPGGVVGCGGSLGTCELYFGAPQPLAVGGVTVCAINQWSGPVTGTLNQQSGASAWSGALRTRLFLGVSVASPCPQCIGDVTANDGAPEGSCDAGIHTGQPCDGNGRTSVAQFGTTSLDCPFSLPATIGTHDQEIATDNGGTVQLTLAAASPDCNGAPGKKCACASCSGNPAVACASDADCAAAGAGTCTNVAGEPRKPNACVDDTSVPGNGTLCIDVAPVGDGVGECPEGPTDTHCAVEGFRSCSVSTDCPAPGDFCTSARRRCYLDNGGIGGSIIAVGAHTTPVDHASYSTFASVHCMAPAVSSSVNIVLGLPGAGRLRIGGQLSEDGSDVTCPSYASFVVTDANGVQDMGWTGIAHDQRFVTDAEITFAVTGCSGAPPSCGDCTLSGPVLNLNAVVPPEKTIFVTSTTTSGSMGGLAGADALCQSLAGGAGLGGTYKAWLSSAAASAASRLTHASEDYVLPGGVVVANGWTDLTDGALDAAINVDENGATVSAAVWTNSTTAGAIDAAECWQWTSTLAGHKGQTGLSTATNAAWTDDIPFEDCIQQRHLYCLEQ